MPQCTCPICDHESTYVRVYQHLQTGHRKSTLSRTLLEEREDDTESTLERGTAETSTTQPSATDPATADRPVTDADDRLTHRDPAIPE
jgi:hypothetical protein